MCEYNSSEKFYDIIGDLKQERRRHNILHPDFADTIEKQLVILVEEVGEVAKAIQDGVGLKDELVQVMAVACRILEGLK